MVVRWWAGPAAVVAAMLVAACGTGSSGTAASSSSSSSASATASAMASAGPPPAAATLDRQLNSAVAKATSVHVTAAISEGGSNVSLNVSLTRSSEFYGQVTYQNRPVTVLVTQGRSYIKVSAAVLKTLALPSSVCALMCNKYLKMSGAQSKSILGGLGWQTLVGGPSASVPHLRYVRTVTVNGEPAWQMKSGLGTVYVAAHGTPYLLQVTNGSDRIDFTQWNSVTIPPPPPASQVIDPSQLKHL